MIPKELQDFKQWVCWKLIERDGKPTKPPYNPVTFQFASNTNPDTWNSYDKAIESSKNFDGVGFVFTEEDDYVGIDLDKCRKEDGTWSNEALEIVFTLDSYTEISPSGKGLHVIVRGKLPEGSNRKGWVEMYDKGRYFTMTGTHFEGTPLEIKDRQEELERVHKKWVAREEKETTKNEPPQQSGILSDDKILELACNAKNADKFISLWNGSTTPYGNDESRADSALMSILAFYTQDDAQLERLWKQSGLARDKTYRPDYVKRTINNALSLIKETYKPPKEKYDNPEMQIPEVLSIKDIYNMDLPDREWLIEGHIAREAITYLVGDPGTHKTTILLDMAISCNEKIPFISTFQTTPIKILFVDKENGLRTFKAHSTQIIKGHDLKEAPENIFFCEANRLEIDEMGILILKKLIMDNQIDLVILDPYVSFISGEENDNKAARQMHDYLSEIKKMNVAIAIPHHNNKEGRYRGASDIKGNADIMLNISKSHNKIEIKTEKNRHVSQDDYFDYQVEVEGETGEYMKFIYLGAPEKIATETEQIADKITGYLFHHEAVKKFKKSQITKEIVVANNFAEKGKLAQNKCGEALKLLVKEKTIRPSKSKGWYEVIKRTPPKYEISRDQEVLE